MPMTELVARKSVTTIQEGSVYKERYTLSQAQPDGTTARQVFFDSAGVPLAEIFGEVDGRTITFANPYADVAVVPNAAGFYCYIQRSDDSLDDEHMVRYGSVFRRQLTFPSSPSLSVNTTIKVFKDNFQRPAGPVGGRWSVLVGKPRIFDNTEWFGLGEDHPNTVGPDHNFFDRYYMRYYQPFNGDTLDLTVSATKKGNGTTIVSVCGNSTGTSYLYLAFNGADDTVELGVGHSPDIGSILSPSDALEAKTSPVDLEVPGDDGLGTYKLRFDDITKTISFYNADYTVKYLDWVDVDDEVPHGKGYRYFSIGGRAGVFNSGVQLAYIEAAGAV